jgi:hypothetical protein
MRGDLRVTLDRLLLMAEERARQSVGDPAPYTAPDCGLCGDAGMVENWFGWFVTPMGRKVEASQDKPVYSRCECNPRDLSTKPKVRRFGA